MTTAFLTNDFTTSARGLAVPGGCGYYRAYLPASAIKGHIGRPTYDPARGWGIKENSTMGVFGYNTVSLKLIMDKWTPYWMREAQKIGQRIYVDVDDHYEGLTEANAAYAATSPENNKRANREHYREVIDTADVITVSTPFLYDWHSKTHDNVIMVRNSIDPAMYPTKHHHAAKPVIGWAGVTAFRNNDLEQLNEWLPQFLDDYDLQFMHAGHDDQYKDITEYLHIDPKRIIRIPTATMDAYPRMLQFDIGIVPLNDIPFNHAKSNIKGLEYAASGIPFIASDLPEYRELHQTGVGHLATTPQQWRAAAEHLLPLETRKKYAKQARAIVLTNWSIQQRAEEWHDAFRHQHR